MKIALKVNGHGQMSSTFINFQLPLAFTIIHIPTQLHIFLMRNFRDFVRSDRRTDKRRQKQYLLAACEQVITISDAGGERL